MPVAVIRSLPKDVVFCILSLDQMHFVFVASTCGLRRSTHPLAFLCDPKHVDAALYAMFPGCKPAYRGLEFCRLVLSSAVG